MTCKRCGGDQWLANHHIVYKSEAGWHSQINNPANLILLCQPCHKWYHDDKKRRQDLVDERGLVDIFGKRIILFDKESK